MWVQHYIIVIGILQMICLKMITWLKCSSLHICVSVITIILFGIVDLIVVISLAILLDRVGSFLWIVFICINFTFAKTEPKNEDKNTKKYKCNKYPN